MLSYDDVNKASVKSKMLNHPVPLCEVLRVDHALPENEAAQIALLYNEALAISADVQISEHSRFVASLLQNAVVTLRNNGKSTTGICKPSDGLLPVVNESGDVLFYISEGYDALRSRSCFRADGGNIVEIGIK